MTNEQILGECLELYDRIRDAEIRLKEIRNICQHEETTECLYSHTKMSAMYSVVCSYCGQYIKMVDK